MSRRRLLTLELQLATHFPSAPKYLLESLENILEETRGSDCQTIYGVGVVILELFYGQIDMLDLN